MQPLIPHAHPFGRPAPMPPIFNPIADFFAASVKAMKENTQKITKPGAAKPKDSAKKSDHKDKNDHKDKKKDESKKKDEHKKEEPKKKDEKKKDEAKTAPIKPIKIV